MTKTLPKFFAAFLFLTLLGFVGFFDYLAGFEVRIGALYCIPVAFATWHFGMVVGGLTSLAASAISFWVERASGEIYSYVWIGYVNAASRLCIFLFVAVSFSYFRRTIAVAQRRVKAFEGKLGVCACCHRVDGGDEFWMDFPTYLRRNSDALPEFKTCPLCVKEKKPELPRLD